MPIWRATPWIRGVTFFDTAESYRFGWSEEAMGDGLRGVRDRVVLSSKTKVGARDTQEEVMAALEGSLRRLRTDYLDIYFNHAVNNVARLQNPEWRAFTERAKEQGKIRFCGMSGHGSRLAECLEYAIDHDLVDVVLVAYSFGQDPDFYDRLRHTFHFVAMQPQLPPALDKAKQKDLGVVAMKTLMGARLNDMRPYEREGYAFARAAMRGVMSNARGDAVISWYQSAGGPLAIWHQWAPQVTGRAIAGGHFFPEQNPEETIAALHGFFSGGVGA